MRRTRMDEKSGEFDYAPFGIVGLETALGLTLKLVQEGVLSLAEMRSRKLSCQPGRTSEDCDKGTLVGRC